MTRKNRAALSAVMLIPGLMASAPITLSALESVEYGQPYRFAAESLETTFLSVRWNSVTFMEDGSYELRNEALTFEWEMQTQPPDKRWALSEDLEGRVFRIEIPGVGGLLFQNGHDMGTLLVAGRTSPYGVFSPAGEWMDFLPEPRIRANREIEWVQFELVKVETGDDRKREDIQ